MKLTGFFPESTTFTLSLRLSLFYEKECTKITLIYNVKIQNLQLVNMKFTSNNYQVKIQGNTKNTYVYYNIFLRIYKNKGQNNCKFLNKSKCETRHTFYINKYL